MKISLRILLFYGLIAFIVIFSSCEDDRLYQSFYPEENLTITSYLESQKENYSYYLRLLEETDLTGALSAYNAYGNNFTLFLPSNTAFDDYFSDTLKCVSLQSEQCVSLQSEQCVSLQSEQNPSFSKVKRKD